jgi:hypothetical protein
MDIGPTKGERYFVRPYSGGDGNSGKSPRTALKTLAAALAKCTAGQNDVVYLLAESNTPANTTDYQLTTLDWNKDLTHLVGVSAGGPYNKRARVAWDAATAVASSLNPLFTLSGNGCRIQGVSFAVGVDNAYATGVKITGDRNVLCGVDIAFPTHDTVDAAGGYALKLDGCDETDIIGCVLGSFTKDIGSGANQLVLLDSGCSMVRFIECDFIERLQSNTNAPAVRAADALSIGFGCVWFKRCNFISQAVSGAYSQTGAFKVQTQTDGRVVLVDCHTNAGKWEADDTNMILNGCVGVPIDDNAGEMLAV